MNKLILQLFAALWQQKINTRDFREQFYSKTGVFLNEEFCLEKIEQAISEQDFETIDIFVQVGFLLTFTPKSLPTMCKLLISPWHHKHEDIAMLLKEIGDSSVVEYLYSAANIQFDYLEYDDTFQFARKCIKALSAIGDDNSIQKLRILTDSKTFTIAEYAKKELLYKKLF